MSTKDWLLVRVQRIIVVYLDDLLVTGKAEQEHLQKLQKDLQRQQWSGLRVKKSKSEFGKKLNEYPTVGASILPHTKSKQLRIHHLPLVSKELRAFQRLVNYYWRFTALCLLRHTGC